MKLIKRTMAIDGVEIVTTTIYFDPETDEDGRLFTRTISEDGVIVDESTVYPGEEGQRRHHQRGGKRRGSRSGN